MLFTVSDQHGWAYRKKILLHVVKSQAARGIDDTVFFYMRVEHFVTSSFYSCTIIELNSSFICIQYFLLLQ